MFEKIKNVIQKIFVLFLVFVLSFCFSTQPAHAKTQNFAVNKIKPNIKVVAKLDISSTNSGKTNSNFYQTQVSHIVCSTPSFIVGVKNCHKP